VIGELLELQVRLTYDGQVFPGMMAVAHALPLSIRLQMIGHIPALAGAGGVGGVLLASGVWQEWSRSSGPPLRW
jgi:hypothetical protein